MTSETSTAGQPVDSIASPTPGAAKETSGRRARQAFLDILRAREMAMVALILITSIILSLTTDHFLKGSNLIAIARAFSMESLVVVGMSMLLIGGFFDLSVGSVMALAGVVTASLIVKGHAPIFLAILGGLAVGGVTGAINGFVVTRIKVNALIATLGMMSIARGVALGYTEGRSQINLPQSFNFIGQGDLWNMPLIVLYMLVIVLVADTLMRRGRAPRQLYYVGGSEKASRLSGINVDMVVFLAFVASGLLAALAGVITTARLTSGVPTAFTGVELRIIAACVIGGCSLAGGEGSVLGAVLGLIFMAIVSNAMTLFGVSIYWEGVVTGTILVVAVSLDMISRRRIRTT
ncbi:MAG: ABC transporter permease [Chloroflexi bacterium]|nr:ABC transporter permease [Chloroflexota bacterium]